MLNRKNFILNFLLWILAFFFGYTMKKVGQNFSLTKIDPKMVVGIDGKNISTPLVNNANIVKDIVINVKRPPYNAVGNGVNDDTDILNQAIADGIALGIPIYIPKGIYRTTGTIRANGVNVMIYGAGKDTNIKPDNNTAYDCIVIGDDSTSGSKPSGYLRDIHFEGNVSQPSGTYAGVKLSAIRQFEVRNVTANKFAIGFDLVNNCFGSEFTNCRTWASDNVIGVNLRTGPQSGNDITFRNCWFSARDTAVHISGGSGGFHFTGGQLSAGSGKSAEDDDLGVIVIGKDYIDGTIGGVANINFDGIDFEGFKYVWLIRAYDEFSMSMKDCSILPNTGKNAIGVMKSVNPSGSQILFTNTVIKNKFTKTTPFDISGTINSTFNINEFSTLMSNAVFGGTARSGFTMLELAQGWYGSGIYRSEGKNVLQLGDYLIRNNVGYTLEVSRKDWGATWLPVQVVFSGTTANRPNSNTYTGMIYFDTTLNKPIYRNASNTGWVDSAGAVV